MSEFKQAVESRRSVYAIGKEIGTTKEEIKKVVEHALKYVPTAFNSQSGRVVVLYGEHHDKLWEITREELRKIVPESAFASTNDKINAFKNGYGTILYFEDQAVIKGLQEQFALYKDNFPIWSQEASGMLQFIVWTALHELGLGASLQHYNPLIDDGVRKEWNIPESWKLIGQMPFGNVVVPPAAKEFAPVDDRIKVFG